MAAGLSDDDLARLLLASVRQLRRRLGRPDQRGTRRTSGKAPASALERAGRQLAAELGQGETEY